MPPSNYVPLVRRPDWSIRLSEFLQESVREGVSLDWEYFNCVSWACDAAEAMTGVDLYEEFRGKSNSLASTWALIHKSGYSSFEEILASRLQEIPPAFARRGDFVLGSGAPVSGPQAQSFDSEGNEPASLPCMPLAVGICDGTVYWSISEHGVGRAPREMAVKAFAIGEHPCLQL